MCINRQSYRRGTLHLPLTQTQTRTRSAFVSPLSGKVVHLNVVRRVEHALDERRTPNTARDRLRVVAKAFEVVACNHMMLASLRKAGSGSLARVSYTLSLATEISMTVS